MLYRALYNVALLETVLHAVRALSDTTTQQHIYEYSLSTTLFAPYIIYSQDTRSTVYCP